MLKRFFLGLLHISTKYNIFWFVEVENLVKMIGLMCCGVFFNKRVTYISCLKPPFVRNNVYVTWSSKNVASSSLFLRVKSFRNLKNVLKLKRQSWKKSVPWEDKWTTARWWMAICVCRILDLFNLLFTAWLAKNAIL